MKWVSPYDRCPTYETPSFLLRPVQPEDAEALLACYSDPVVAARCNTDHCIGGFFSGRWSRCAAALHSGRRSTKGACSSGSPWWPDRPARRWARWRCSAVRRACCASICRRPGKRARRSWRSWPSIAGTWISERTGWSAGWTAFRNAGRRSKGWLCRFVFPRGSGICRICGTGASAPIQ